MTEKNAAVSQRRNKGFDATHQTIIAATVRLISEKGVEALSIAAVARAAGIDRTTLYYHFADREALLATAKEWSSEQLTRGFIPTAPRAERTAHIARFVLENPELIKLWIEDFVSPGDIRARYPQWDALVDGMAANLAHQGEAIDVEVYCTIMLTAAFIAPHVYKNSVRPDLSIETIIERFTREQARVLQRDAKLSGE
jgi:AcrR family transcriptional regulator